MKLDQDSLDMREVQAGRLDRFTRLVSRYQSPLFRYAQSVLGLRSLSEDAVQETFLAAFRSRDTYDCRKPFRGWIWTIHVNACRRLARKQWSRQESPGDDKVPEPASPEAPVGDGLERDEQKQKLVETLTLLPEEQAEAIRMRFFGELSFEEIGAAMDCSAATAKSRVRYGLAKMAKHLSGQEIFT